MNISDKKTFMTNMFLMSGTMLIIRIMTMGFNIYFTSVIGAASSGIFHLIFSVYGFAVTFSVSGTGLAVTRLVSEYNDIRARNTIVKKSLFLCLATGCTASVLLTVFSSFLSRSVLGESYASKAFSLLAVSLPAVSVSAILRGYFIASKKIIPLTFSQLSEEILTIVITLMILSKTKNTPDAYISMIYGITFSALICAVCDIVVYRVVNSGKKSGNSTFAPGYKDILYISVPVALGSYLRSALVALENTLIPGRLALSGNKNPLSEYGIIKGMSLPLMMFPSVFIGAFSAMLVPEMANRRASRRPNGIRYITEKAIKTTLWFSCTCAGIFLICHNLFGERFYSNSKAGIYLGMLALLIIPMYTDTVVDSMLKGLNQQVSSLKYNIIDSVLRVVFIWFAVPAKGIFAYIFMLYASELFNLFLSLRRLLTVTELTLRAKTVLLPIFVSAAIFAFIRPMTASAEIKAVIFVLLNTVAAVLSEILNTKIHKKI